MRLLAIALASLSLGGAGTLQVTLKGSGHAPKINTHWAYSVTAAVNRKPVAAKLTLQIVDPLGGVHIVQRGPTTQNLRNWRFKGTYRDYIIWPPDSNGVPLKLRAKVTAGGVTKAAVYAVTPHR